MNKPSPEQPDPSDNGEISKEFFKEVHLMLERLPDYTAEDWTEREDSLWKLYIDDRRAVELRELEARGIASKEAQKLARIVWVERRPGIDGFAVEPVPTGGATPSVPALWVHRNGSFDVEEGVKNNLRYHPLLAKSANKPPGRTRQSERDDRARVFEALAEVEAIGEKLGLGYQEMAHFNEFLTGYSGEDNRVAECGYAAHWLGLLLDPRTKVDDLNEDLEWLATGLNGKRFWRLLHTALVLGESLERYRILDKRKGEETLLRSATAPAGKRTGEIGQAVERMIENYMVDNDTLPRALQLLRWLGSEQPFDGGESLTVDHDLWTDVMQDVTWPQFQELVKSAKRRLKR